MKELLLKIYKKHRKVINIAIIGLVLIIIGKISWSTYFSKVKIFEEQEKKFSTAVKQYYEYHSQKLPRKGESRTLTLQDLYDKGLVEDLYIPKTKKTCDPNESRVRVFQNGNGEYIYNSYLKCGKFASKVDHLGPEIKLNSEEEMTIAINTEYKDPGIMEVKDDKDGRMDVKNVIVDTSKVDTKKVGTYKVTYTISDSSYNKTVVTRTVIVKENLTTLVRNATDESGYYKGDISNNYIMFSGMLWRIVNVNEDGTIKIVSDENISDIPYSANNTEYKDSNVKEWLDKMFYPILHEPDKYIVSDATWCLDQTPDMNYKNTECTNTIKDKIGLLTLADFNNTISNKISFLSIMNSFYMITKKDDNNAYYIINDGEIETMDTTERNGIRPVLVLKANLYTTSGTGTKARPYRLGDYTIGKANDMLNTRLVGEYVNYSGMIFRISGFDKDNNIKLTAIDSLHEESYLLASYGNKENKKKVEYLFDPKDEYSIGYKLNDDFIDYVDETLIVKHEYKIYEYDPDKKYNQYKEKSSFKAKLSIPSSFDLFSSMATDTYSVYWLLDYVEDGALISFGRLQDSIQNGFKLVIYVNKDSKIFKGNGTFEKPFFIR